MTCQEKRRYETKARAKIAARRLHQRGHPRASAYRCPECGFWHLTSANAASRSFLRAKGRTGC